jgi:hypothetical protein
MGRKRRVTPAIGALLGALAALGGCAAAHSSGGAGSASTSADASAPSSKKPSAQQTSGAAGRASPSASTDASAARDTGGNAAASADAGSGQAASNDPDAAAPAPAACAQGPALQGTVGGAVCAQRMVTACGSSADPTGHLREIVSSMLADCSITLMENVLDIAFEHGCATRLSIDRTQLPVIEPQQVSCLVDRLAAQRFDCLEARASDCVRYEVSTLATQ